MDGRRLRAFNPLRLQKFLGLIALKRGPHPRSQLAFELWSDSHESRARTHLRKLLHKLRQSLPGIGEFVEIDNGAARLIPTALTDVEVWRFRDALAGGDLELAARLYAGDLLPSLYDDWVLHDRAKLRDEFYDALVQLAERAVRRGDHAATLRYSRRVIDLEPSDEAAVRVQIEAHVALGDRTAALRVYHRCAAALESDFAVAPGEKIARIYRQLQASGTKHNVLPTRIWNLSLSHRSWVALLSSIGSSKPGRQYPRVGRISCWWPENLASERPGLHTSLPVACEQEGMWWHQLAPTRLRAGRPGALVVDLLRSDALQINVDGAGAGLEGELARLLPELLDTSQSSGLDRPDDLAQRHRLFDAVNRAMVSDRPRLLIIDDLQWCDVETIELIGFFARASRTAPVLIVGTVRLEEVAEGHTLGDLVDALAKDRVVTTVHLDRLDEATTATRHCCINATRQNSRHVALRGPLSPSETCALMTRLEMLRMTSKDRPPVGEGATST